MTTTFVIPRKFWIHAAAGHLLDPLEKILSRLLCLWRGKYSKLTLQEGFYSSCGLGDPTLERFGRWAKQSKVMETR
jgi:hypothetical protein